MIPPTLFNLTHALLNPSLTISLGSNRPDRPSSPNLKRRRTLQVTAVPLILLPSKEVQLEEEEEDRTRVEIVGLLRLKNGKCQNT
jgi:hypothetical protein